MWLPQFSIQPHLLFYLIRDIYMSLNEQYPAAWKSFRHYSGENSHLLKLIEAVISGTTFQHCHTMLDIGCGDGILAQQVISSSHLSIKPQLIYLQEPLSGFRQDLQSTSLAINSVFPNTKVKIFESKLSDFNHDPVIDIPGLILVIHASYYFGNHDFAKLQELKNFGYKILVIENHIDCWVSQIFAHLGNNYHPQFDPARFDYLLNHLGIRESSLQHFEIQADSLPEYNCTTLREMMDFFTCCWSNGELPEEAHLIQRLSNAFNLSTNVNPRFVYRYVYV
jgi:hypothetical protein